jgi:fructose-1,6-bisphosphatase
MAGILYETRPGVQTFRCTSQRPRDPPCRPTGTQSWILSAMSISAKIISNKVRCTRLEDVLGEAGSGNVQGEQQQKLDVISNNVLLRLLG